MNGNNAVRIDPRGSARRSPTAGNRGQGGKRLHPTTRQRIYERDGWRCVWCRCEVAQLGMRGAKGVSVEGVLFTDGLQIRQASIDHVVPRALGGTNAHTNLITCCARCNAVRGDVSAFSFAMHEACGSRELARITLRRVRNARRQKLPPAPVARIPR
jgi:hypothetical protein